MSSYSEDDQVSVRLIEALATVWRRIRADHPEVPAVVLIPAPAHQGKFNVLGHFAALRWSARQGDHHLHEVVVVAEHMNRPAEDIVETLLHEAAHALNFERRVKDCSRSQYHNRRFKSAAEELGLDVAQLPHYGFAKTSLPPATAARYQAEIEGLSAVLIHRRTLGLTLGPRPPPVGGGSDDGDEDDSPRCRSRKATCSCPFIIRVSKSTITATSIRCETCGALFRLAE